MQQYRTRSKQATTAEVLRVISSSPGELEPAFEAMLANASAQCSCHALAALGPESPYFFRGRRALGFDQSSGFNRVYSGRSFPKSILRISREVRIWSSNVFQSFLRCFSFSAFNCALVNNLNLSDMGAPLRVSTDGSVVKKRPGMSYRFDRFSFLETRIAEIGRSGCATICSSTSWKSRSRRSIVRTPNRCGL
jgi:hypothetical protein